MKEVIDQIKKIRLEKGYSQWFMARKLDVKQNSYSKLELGRTALSLRTLFNIAEILEVDPRDLINLKFLEPATTFVPDVLSQSN